MALGQSVPRQRARSVKGSHRTKARRTKSASNVSAANVESPPENPANLDALRKARLEHLDNTRHKKMKYVGERVEKVPVKRRDADVVQKVPETSKRHKTTSGRKHSHKKVPAAVPKADEGVVEYVYRQEADVKSKREDTSEAGIVSVVEDAREPLPHAKARGSVVTDHKYQREDRRPLHRRQSEPVRRRKSYSIDIGASDRRRVRRAVLCTQTDEL